MKMAMEVSYFTRSNPLFATYAFYTGVLCTKMFAVTFLIIRQGVKKKMLLRHQPTRRKVKFSDEFQDSVNILRRAHRSDLENIPPFIFISFLYILTEPDKDVALNVFRVFTVARIAHTVVYAFKPLPRSGRAIASSLGLGVTIYILQKVIQHYK